MELKHTKGDWWLAKDKPFEENKTEYLVISGHSASSKNIARVFKAINVSKEEQEANAKLIAAAPELLEALIKCEKQLELAQARLSQSSNDDSKAQCYANARGAAQEAIKKATE